MLEEAVQKRIISQNREFMKGYRENDPYEADFESDQDLKRPQPPLVKTPYQLSEFRCPGILTD